MCTREIIQRPCSMIFGMSAPRHPASGRPARHRRVQRARGAGRCAAARAGVRSRRRDLLRPERRRARAGGGSVARVAVAGARAAAVGQRRPGGRPGRAAEAAVHRVAADDHARTRRGDETLAERFATALAAELHAVGISLDYTPVLDILTNPKNPVIGDRALAERAEDVARLGVGDHPHAAGGGHRRVRQALSRARRHEHRLALRAAARRASAGSPARRSSSCRSRPRSRPTSPRS